MWVAFIPLTHHGESRAFTSMLSLSLSLSRSLPRNSGSRAFPPSFPWLSWLSGISVLLKILRWGWFRGPQTAIPEPGGPRARFGQGRRMLLAEHPRTRLQEPHLQPLGLVPPALVLVCRCKVGHAGQGTWMLLAEHPRNRGNDLHL